jgi:hypothetical protein
MFELIRFLIIDILVLVVRSALGITGDLERQNLFLKYQLHVLKRQNRKRIRFTMIDRVVLTTTVEKISQFARFCMIVKPATILKWKNALVRWKWRYGNKPGRPKIKPSLTSVI